MKTETMIFVPATKKIATFLKAEGFEYEKMEGKKYRVVTDKYDFDTTVDELISKLVALYGADCTIEGYYDVYEYTGSSMKFRYIYNGFSMKKYESDSFSSMNAADFDDYEAFCDEYEDRFSEEEYETFCEDDYYILDDGSVVTDDEIPMVEV